MGHLDGREGLERKLAAIWGREFSRQFKAVSASVENSQPFDAPAIWFTAATRSVQANKEILGAIFQASADQIADDIGRPIEKKADGFVDFAIINDRGVAWATEYSFNLVKDINATTLGKLRKIIPQGMQEGLSIDDITKKLAGTFGRARAQSIAITETTRAAVVGQREFISQLNKVGVYTDTFWLTARDSRVDDKICRPLEGVMRMDGVYQHPNGGTYTGPPGHVNCRCTELEKLIEEVPA